MEDARTLAFGFLKFGTVYVSCRSGVEFLSGSVPVRSRANHFDLARVAFALFSL